MFGRTGEIGIDLGTTSVLVYVPEKGVVLREPSVVAIDSMTKKIRAVGEEAQTLIGRTPGDVVAIRPLKDGVISDYYTTEKMLRNFLLKVCKNRIFKPRVVICVPSSVTGVEERAVVEAAEAAGARQALVIEEPLAAAIGRRDRHFAAGGQYGGRHRRRNDGHCRHFVRRESSFPSP